MGFNTKTIIFTLAIINFLIILPTLFILNGHIWLDMYFIFWYIILLEIWLVFFYKFRKGSKKIPEEKKDDFLLSMILFIVCFLGLSFTAGSARKAEFWFPWLWFVIKLSISLFLALCFLSKYIILRELVEKRSSNSSKVHKKTFRFWKKFASFKMKKRIVVPLLSFLLLFHTLYFFPMATLPIMPAMAERNINDLSRIVSELTDQYQDEENKTKSILRWFDRYTGNIYNTWAPPLINTLTNKNVYFSIAIGDPYLPIICVRNEGDNDPLWILTSRCGNCGEHCLLFTEMAIAANLTVRRIHVNGVDHKWNEVQIDNESIIADATWVVLKKGEDGFNVPHNKYENSFGNFTYVYALSPNNETKIDVTKNYTDLAHINITTIDEKLNPVSNVTIKVYSNDLGDGIDTGLVFTTNTSGEYYLEIGGSNITLECENKELKLYNTTTKKFNENKYYDVTLTMKILYS